MDLAQNGQAVKLEFVSWIVRLEFSDVADPPDVVSLSIFTTVLPVHFSPRDLLAYGNGFQHGTVGKSAPANVIDHA